MGEYLVKFSTQVKEKKSELSVDEVLNTVLTDGEITIDKFQEESKYITSPSYVEKYNFITKDEAVSYVLNYNKKFFQLNHYLIYND